LGIRIRIVGVGSYYVKSRGCDCADLRFCFVGRAGGAAA